MVPETSQSPMKGSNFFSWLAGAGTSWAGAS